MYINGCGAITPQETYNGTLPVSMTEHQGYRLDCLEPEYKSIIPPRVSRRMSRIVKMSVAASRMALTEAGIEIPDGIITGSGLGCMSDTEKFLTAIAENEEKLLNPAPFIYSTHNTISSQIALFLKCTGYNQTYVQGAHSFESGVLDASMLLREAAFSALLVGGADEMTTNLFTIMNRFGHWKRNEHANRDLFHPPSKGTMAGEGSVFFVVGASQTEHAYATIEDMDMYYGKLDGTLIVQRVQDFLKNNRRTLDDLDLCFLGKNGDNRFDGIYNDLEKQVSSNCPTALYKHLCGEYYTSSAFATWLIAHLIKQQTIPDYIQLSAAPSKPLKTVLSINTHQDKYLSLMLIEACDQPTMPI